VPVQNFGKEIDARLPEVGSVLAWQEIDSVIVAVYGSELGARSLS
jgi:hypothetical protein